MTYLQLVNQVLSRLRENQTTATAFLGNPYQLSIGNHVNDAKRIVEDSWKWSHNKITEDITTTPSIAYVVVPDTADTNVQIVDIYNADTGAYIHQRTSGWFRKQTTGVTVPSGPPQYWCVPTGYSNGLKLAIYPTPDDAYNIQVTTYKAQPELALATDEMRIPAAPVYLMATALASRERGELAGQPTSELFGLADRALADAIALDSALQSEHTEWFYSGNDARTNVGRY